ncbi:hypothetical protein Ciccas_014521, partial [Cichlidogyrus casuarinus]
AKNELNGLSTTLLTEIAELNFNQDTRLCPTAPPLAIVNENRRTLLPQDIIHLCKMIKSKQQNDDLGISVRKLLNLPWRFFEVLASFFNKILKCGKVPQ